MKIGSLINRGLSLVDLAVTRRSTLDRIVAENAKLRVSFSATEEHHSGACADMPGNSLFSELTEMRKDLLRRQVANRWATVDALVRALGTETSFRTCPLCDHEGPSSKFAEFETQCAFGGGRLIRYQCPNCDVIFGADKMLQLSDAELTQEYEWHYSTYEEGDSTEQELRAFHCLNPTPDGLYLNYGAGAWSRSISKLRADGWQVLAFEPHASAASGEDHVIRSWAELSGMSFDGIFSNNVLEHLRWPVAELRRLRSILTSGGKMAHATPCFEYLYEYTRFHLFFFLGRSREFLAREAGLYIEEFISDDEFICCVLAPGES